MKGPTSTKPFNSCFQIYHLQQKLKYYLQNLCIFTYKNIVINFKIINFKNNFTIKTNILLLANTDQTFKCVKILLKTDKQQEVQLQWTPNI